MRSVLVAPGLGVTLDVADGVTPGVGEGVPQSSEIQCSLSSWKPMPSTYCSPTAHTTRMAANHTDTTDESLS